MPDSFLSCSQSTNRIKFQLLLVSTYLTTHTLLVLISLPSNFSTSLPVFPTPHLVFASRKSKQRMRNIDIEEMKKCEGHTPLQNIEFKKRKRFKSQVNISGNEKAREFGCRPNNDILHISYLDILVLCESQLTKFNKV